ncbi:MAG TPA: site-specific integrase [Anaerolineae bacterium]|nr:site-specific integrase [Anaerolineae bacterium]
MRKEKFNAVYQFKITLKGIKPPIWRRIQVPATYNFWDLHVAVQDAMGWLDYHLHKFTIKDPSTGAKADIGISDDELDFGSDVLPEKYQNIAGWFSMSNRVASYTYDFGDNWEHEVRLEEVLSREKDVIYPVCIAGKRACPPEDCGGVWGYEDLLDVIQDPEYEEREEIMEWLGGRFDPGRFNAAEVTFDDPDKRWEIAFGQGHPMGLAVQPDVPAPEGQAPTGIENAIGAFLENVRREVSPRTSSEYEESLAVFTAYLASYTNLSGIEEIDRSHFSEFLSHFYIRKYLGSSPAEANRLLSHLKAFAKWSSETFATSMMEEYMLVYRWLKDDLPRVLSVPHISEFWDYDVPDREPDDTIDDFWEVAMLGDRSMELQSYTGMEKVGPVVIPKEMAAKLKAGDIASLELGRFGKRWYILEMGLVSPGGGWDEESDKDDAGTDDVTSDVASIIPNDAPSMGVPASTTKVKDEAQTAPVELSAAATVNLLRLDVIAMLNYIGDRELKLTQAGNLTLKDVRAINGLFIEPEELDNMIGDHVYKLRTEEEAPRVRFLRVLIQKAGLTKIRHNKISQTKAAQAFINKDPYPQLKLLFTAWLEKDHWGRLIRSPQLVEPLMHRADEVARYLVSLPVGKRVDFERFGYGLLDALGLEVVTEDPADSRIFMYVAIAVSVLHPLELFGVISTERAEDAYGFSKITAFRLTELGAALLSR